MTLHDLQVSAWQQAREKGHHDALQPGMPTTDRLGILREIASVYSAVTAITQHIKREGITDIYGLEMLVLNAFEALVGFRHALWSADVPDPMTRETATTLRLVLIHTEVDEAIAADPQHLPGELADIMVRTAETAQHLMIDLTGAVVQVQHENGRRPYKYGTPDAVHVMGA